MSNLTPFLGTLDILRLSDPNPDSGRMPRMPLPAQEACMPPASDRLEQGLQASQALALSSAFLSFGPMVYVVTDIFHGVTCQGCCCSASVSLLFSSGRLTLGSWGALQSSLNSPCSSDLS